VIELGSRRRGRWWCTGLAGMKRGQTQHDCDRKRNGTHDGSLNWQAGWLALLIIGREPRPN